MHALTTLTALDTKTIACAAVGALAGFIALNITFALLAWALWAWLALVVAFIASLAVAYVTDAYMDASGYDVAVAATAKSIGFVKGLFA